MRLSTSVNSLLSVCSTARGPDGDDGGRPRRVSAGDSLTFHKSLVRTEGREYGTVRPPSVMVTLMIHPSRPEYFLPVVCLEPPLVEMFNFYLIIYVGIEKGSTSISPKVICS